MDMASYGYSYWYYVTNNKSPFCRSYWVTQYNNGIDVNILVASSPKMGVRW